MYAIRSYYELGGLDESLQLLLADVELQQRGPILDVGEVGRRQGGQGIAAAAGTQDEALAFQLEGQLGAFGQGLV